MTDRLDTALIFGLLTLFHLIGGAALGAGLRARRRLPAAWGVLVGVAPLYFGGERIFLLGDWVPFIWQTTVVVAAATGMGFRLPRWRAFFLRQGMSSLMIGTLIMAAAAVTAGWLVSRGNELISQIVGGIGFLFGAMWFGAGIKQMRGK